MPRITKSGTDEYRWQVEEMASALIEGQKVKAELKMPKYKQLKKDVKAELSQRAKASSSAKNSV